MIQDCPAQRTKFMLKPTPQVDPSGARGVSKLILGADVRDDAQLIDESLTGQSDSFGQLVQKYQDRLFNTMVHVTGSRKEAEDVVQDAFVLAYVKLEMFAGKSAFYTWLCRIAFNISVSRRHRKRPEVSVESMREASGNEPTDGAETAEQYAERREREAQVYVALDQLSDEQRSILVLREMEGCCYEAIAEVLELPVGAVRSRLHRARSQLRENLLRLDYRAAVRSPAVRNSRLLSSMD